MTTLIRITRRDAAPYLTDVKEFESGTCIKVTTLKTRGDEVEVNIWDGKSLTIVEREIPEDANA